jgi:chaperonin GroES
VLPDSAKEKPKRGKVITRRRRQAPRERRARPVNVKKGDEVIFTSYAGTEIKLDGEELMIMSEDDVWRRRVTCHGSYTWHSQRRRTLRRALG